MREVGGGKPPGRMLRVRRWHGWVPRWVAVWSETALRAVWWVAVGAVGIVGLTPGVLWSQQKHQRPKQLDVRSCAKADSLLGHKAEHLSRRILATPGPEGTTVLMTRPRPPESHSSGLVDFGLRSESGANSTTFPMIALDLKVVSPAARPIAERQLLLFADSMRIDVGSMTAMTQQWPDVEGVVENMAAALSFPRLTDLARASEISGTLGSMTFVVDDDRVDDVRAFWVALVCRAGTSAALREE